MLPNLINRGDCTELGCKVAMFLLRLHHAPIVANQLLMPTLEKLDKFMKRQVGELRVSWALIVPKQKSTDKFSQDLIGYNYFGMQFLQRQIENAEGVQLFRDATVERKKGEKKRKKRENLKRSIMVLNSWFVNYIGQ